MLPLSVPWAVAVLVCVDALVVETVAETTQVVAPLSGRGSVNVQPAVLTAGSISVTLTEVNIPPVVFTMVNL